MNPDFFLFMLIGFVAQVIDGALGMAYGVTANSFLLSFGLPPAAASACVHVAEVFTTGVSGFSHFKLGNVDRYLLARLLIPGVIGGVAGAYLLSEVPGGKIKPFIAVYLAAMGVLILIKAIRQPVEREVRSTLIPLGLAGGFFDAIGGGGWGPIVTSTLVARGNNPRFTIGSVNASEFFVTLAESITFLLTLTLSRQYLWNIGGLLLGGVLAAPLAALVTKRVSARRLMLGVGILIIILSIRTIYLVLTA